MIIGGGSVGCETAEYLAEKGKKVTVIEMLDTMAEKMVNVARTILMGHLKGLGVTLLTSCKCLEITDSSVACQDKEGTVHTIPADTVVAAVGDKADNALYRALEGKVPELYNIGTAQSRIPLLHLYHRVITAGWSCKGFRRQNRIVCVMAYN